MIKYLALGLVALGLAGCMELAPPGPTYAESAPDNKLVAVGHGKDVEWRCVQDQADEHVVWIDCQFHKFSHTTAQKETCIRLSYYKSPLPDAVASSRLVCSDMLDDNENTNHYVAFQKFERLELMVTCGVDNSTCKLVVREEARPAPVPVPSAVPAKK